MIKSKRKRAFTADDDALNVDSAGRLDQLLNCYDTSSLHSSPRTAIYMVDANLLVVSFTIFDRVSA